MPTQDEVRSNVERFEREYGSRSLAGRMRWWAHNLGIDRKRLFRLLGSTAAEAGQARLEELERVVSQREERAEQIDELLGQVLASYDYDVHAMSTALHRPLSPQIRQSQRAVRHPGELDQPRPRPEVLLNKIVAGGPTALTALLAYLSRPAARQ